MRKIFVLFILSLCLFSCKSGKLTTTETKPTETIIFGKLTINSEKEIKYKDIWIHFNERLWGKNITRLDENGCFSAKLPLGHNNVAMLVYGKKNKNVPKDYISIDVENTDNIYYIGDIHIDWKPTNKDQAGAMAGLFGGIAGSVIAANQNGEQLPVNVIESAATIEMFKQQFPANLKEIKTKLVIVNKDAKKEDSTAK